MRCLFPITLFVLLLTACSILQKTAPYKLVSLKGAAFAAGKNGYDPTLPGFHLRGGIGRVRLVPQGSQRPDRLVLEIQTSPGMPAHLESFRLSTPTVQLNPPLFQPGARFRVQPLGADTNSTGRPELLVPVADYFVFEVKNERVRVTLLPVALKLLSGPCTIEWVDYYR